MTIRDDAHLSDDQNLFSPPPSSPVASSRPMPAEPVDNVLTASSDPRPRYGIRHASPCSNPSGALQVRGVSGRTGSRIQRR
jgi:hypothetical protein